MDPVPRLPVPQGVASWFGGSTWSYEEGPFGEPWCRSHVPDVPVALQQLQFLYPRDVVEQLVNSGYARLVYGLRGGFKSWVGEMLQLGSDLACCPEWRERTKLVGELRTPRGYSRARPEVGIWAGLRRVGLHPLVEQADSASAKRADWLVPCDRLNVAIELKTLSDPTYERDRTELWHAFAATVEDVRRGCPPAAITWTLSDAVDSCMGRDHVQFCLQQLPAVCDEIRRAAAASDVGAHIRLPTAGELVLRPTAALVSSYKIIARDANVQRLIERAAHKVHEAAPQLAATRADLRVAVVYGSREWLPNTLARHVAWQARERFPEDEVDWVVIVNEGMLDDDTWMTDAVEAARREALHIPDRVLEGLVEWGSQVSLKSQ